MGAGAVTRATTLRASFLELGKHLKVAEGGELTDYARRTRERMCIVIRSPPFNVALRVGAVGSQPAFLLGPSLHSQYSRPPS